MTSNDASSLRKDLDNLRTDLRQLAERVRVKIHLAGMEAKDVWGKLEPKLESFEHKADELASGVAGDLRDAGVELKESLSKLIKQL